MAAGVGVEFVRLTDIPAADVLALLNEPRNRRHMPLSTAFTASAAEDWVQDKDAQWARNGFGPWAVLVDGRFAGWTGFQAERDGADFALVLLPRFWGHGFEVARQAFASGFGELGLCEVFIALPASRSPDRAVQRFGFRAAGQVTYGKVTFSRYRLAKIDWVQRDVVHVASSRAPDHLDHVDG